MRHPFLRTLAGSGVTTDPNFENVTLLLHGDGTNGAQNNAFIDSSANAFAITRNGNTTQGTFSPYGDRWSNYFDGTGDCLVTPANTAFQLGTGDFSVELWYYATTSATSGRALFGIGNDASGAIQLVTKWPFNAQPDNRLLLNATNGPQVATDTVFAVNSWNHIALSRASGTVSIYLNGTRVGNGSFTQDITANQLVIGRPHTAKDQEYVAGYISNFRLVKGTALYSGTTITVPTAPLTAITNTSLLTCQSNRFSDASTNNFTITRNGDVSVQRFSPFSPTAAYAAGTIGGSGYFDGSGDNLKVTSSLLQLGTSDFTLEFFAYFTSLGSGDIDFFRHDTSNQAFGIGIYNSGTDLRIIDFRSGSTVVNFGAKTQIRVNEWTHVAFSRSGNDFRCFLNGSISSSGVQVSSQNLTLTTTNTFRIMDGVGLKYINDYRLIIGTAQYTANFTPPTAPLTAITNTSLLLNFTNAAILDNAMMAVPETVGNAQIDTTIKKYGTGSMEFDGTGDWLLIPDSIDQRLGTGNFTIECWLYLSATGTARGIVGKGTSTTGWLLSTNTSNAVVFTYGTSTITSTGTLSGTTWYHIAVVREGTSTNQTKIYIGGTNDGTGTVSTDFTQTNAAYVGANRTGGDPMNGFIDDLRITKGVARYTANFTPPTAAFPDL